MIPRKDLKKNSWYLGAGRGSHVALWDGRTFNWPGDEMGQLAVQSGKHYEDGGCFLPMVEIGEEYLTVAQWEELRPDQKRQFELKAWQAKCITTCSECKCIYEAASDYYAKEPDRLCGPCFTVWASTRPCGDCGAKDQVFTTKKEEILKYRNGDESVELKCVVPLRTCGACGFQFLDYEVEQIHLMATNKYLLSVGEKPQSK